VFCVPWSILGVMALMNQLGYMGDTPYDVLGIISNIVFFFLSPLWVFSMAVFLSPGNY
jgi:Na+-driven multidrug efflux pump